MFRTSSEATMPDLFKNFVSHLEGTRATRFNDPEGWHNIFWKHITSQIDERVFEVLFSDFGRPNASTRVLLGMMAMKEGFGWSDRIMFEQCDFNIQVMRALGLTNIDDEVPGESTYYNFRKALYEYQVKTGENLIDCVFKQLTQKQSELFGVKGGLMRMDSKLIGSNISKSSRLELIINVLSVFYGDIKSKAIECRLKEEDREQLENLLNKKAGQIIYEIDNQERELMLERFGYVLIRIQELYNEGDSEKYHLIVRVLSEQYKIESEGRILLREVKEIKSDSLQSPYDEDAAYRRKGEQEVRGYSVNITESCQEEGLNLITDVEVEKSNYADNCFLQDALERSEQIVGEIEKVNVDGAYHSAENQDFAKEKGINIILSGIQGRESKYEFNIKEGEAVEVINKKTGEVHKAERNKADGYKIKENGRWRYFSMAYLSSYLLRKQIEEIPRGERKRRNNVEATIFQLCYHTRNNKTRYRGLIKHQFWAFSRSIWINFVRIKNYVTSVGGVCLDGSKIPKISQILTKNEEILTKIEDFIQSKKEIFGIMKKLLFFNINIGYTSIVK